MNTMDEKYNYVIYLHRNMINGKVYVGQTIQLPSRRWAKGKGYPSNPHFNRAIEKYGWDNFSHIILEQFYGTPEEAGKKEEQYIEIYNSLDPEYGYNIRNGSAQIPPNMLDAAIKWMAEHPEFGLKKAAEMHKWQQTHPEEVRIIREKFNKAGIEARKRPVKCIETNQIYESATQAAREVNGTSQGKICMCCRGERKTCGGFHWEYVTEENDND